MFVYKDGNMSMISFPKDWRGKTGEELEDISGISGLTFCHNGGFLCTANSLNAAWDVVDYCLRNKRLKIQLTE